MPIPRFETENYTKTLPINVNHLALLSSSSLIACKKKKKEEHTKDLNTFFMICISYTDHGNSNRFYRFAQSQPNVKQSMQSCVCSLRDTSVKNREAVFCNDISAMHGSAFRFHRRDKLLEFYSIFYFSSQLESSPSSQIPSDPCRFPADLSRVSQSSSTAVTVSVLCCAGKDFKTPFRMWFR